MHPANDPQDRWRASAAARRAVIGLARDRGAELSPRPEVSGYSTTVSGLDALTGARTARDIELAARREARDYLRAAREAGHSWDQIGQALGVAPNADADQAGLTVAEAAYTYAAGNPNTDTAMRYGRSFSWRCQSCNHTISDRGLIGGPADDELGHAEDCTRLAAAVAEWDAGWEAEP
jgi:hypothetical protein